MPLWSLTQERVEKLRRQIGDIETEVDKLIKLTKEDLWRMDLDLFIEEWRTQLDEEHKRKRRINNMGRRTSTKVKVAASGPAIKKRKGLGDYDDDDFDDRPKSKKPAPAKVKRKEIYIEKKQPLIPSMFGTGQGTQGKTPSRFHDGNSSEPEPDEENTADTTKQAKKVKASAKSTSVPIVPDSNGVDDVTKPVAKKVRAAASKPIRYGGGSESDDSNGDDLLGDITNMVKGLPGGETKSSGDAKSLFSTSRAIPSVGVGLKPAPSLATKNYAEISDDDDTNFEGLVPQQSPRRSINIVQNALLTDDEDEDDDIRPLTTNKSRSQTVKSSKVPSSQKTGTLLKSDIETEDDGGGDAIVPKTKSQATPCPIKQST